MPELIHIYRGSLVENIIRGDIIILEKRAKISREFGNGHKVSYMRSAAKPIQASAGIERGIIKAFNLNQKELAVMCGSHNGDSFHLEAVRGILNKIGLDEDALKLGADYSYNPKIKEKMLSMGIPKSKLINNCSGKHSAMLAICIKEGWDINNYFLPGHPVQELILNTVAAYTEMNKEEIIIGTDGCGVPVFGMPLYNMALGYYNLLNPQIMEEKAEAAGEIVRALAAYPEMIAGRGEFCTCLIKETKGRLIAKKGADGIYCCAQKGGPAIALKIEDGNTEVLSQVLLEVLNQMGLLSLKEAEALAGFGKRNIINCQGDIVGRAEAVFTL